DDADVVRRLCRDVLVGHGYEVLEAVNGLEAVRAYLQYRPDAVLLDIEMPVLDGLSALSQIIGADPNARVAMLTVPGEIEAVKEARRRGARDFVVKPWEPARVIASVEKLTLR